MTRLGLVNAYGPAGFVLTVPLFDFLRGISPAIKAADDAPPDGKPVAMIVPPGPPREPEAWPALAFAPPDAGWSGNAPRARIGTL